MAYQSQLVIGGKIGGGSSGNVHEGQDSVHGKVAVKVLKQRPGESTNDWAIRSHQLLGEAQLLKKSTHSNVVQVLGVVNDSTNDVLHLVAEFCDGGSADKPYRLGPLTIKDVRKIITDSCRGLEHIHSCGMIHRDIKPGNILRHRNTYKIGDFGLVSEDLVLGYASADGYLCHLAPEVFDDPVTGTRGTTGRKTDVWALGMTVYRLLNGHQFVEEHFPAKMLDEVRQLIINGGFCYSLKWLPHIPNCWRKFVFKAMNDDPANRFQSALEMSQSLARLPIDPAWECNYTTSETKWNLKDGARTINVTWKVHSARKHEWYAVREGGGKREVSVGGHVGGILNSSEAKNQLTEFFANYG